MTRLLVHVEGETEETFVAELLRPYLSARGFTSVSARIVGNARQRQNRGGIKGWDSVRKDIVSHLKQDPACCATTMVDYYGLPRHGAGAWPGRNAAATMPFQGKAPAVEDAIAADIAASYGDSRITERFVPYVVMHEFEGLLFSDCAAFGRGIGRTDLTPAFQTIRAAFQTPEEIDDSAITAPSKRIEQLLPRYEKPLFGNLAALEIGIDALERECPLFRRWLDRLRAVAR